MDDIDELIEQYQDDPEFKSGALDMRIQLLRMHIKGLEQAAQKRCEELQALKKQLEDVINEKNGRIKLITDTYEAKDALLTGRIKELKQENERLRKMIDNSLTWEDLRNE